jgi:hypothetical protein
VVLERTDGDGGDGGEDDDEEQAQVVAPQQAVRVHAPKTRRTGHQMRFLGPCTVVMETVGPSPALDAQGLTPHPART